MRKFLSGGITLAFLCIPVAAMTETPTTASAAPTHRRPSFYNAHLSRAYFPAHVQRLFKALDLNHDGFVSRDEIASSQARFDEKMTKSAPKRVAKAFDRLDANHDGQITQADIEAVRAARLAARSQRARSTHHPASSLFARADANKDGAVTRSEYDAAVASGKVKSRHANMRGSAIVRLFDAADVNRDGRLSLGEAQQAALQHFDAADLNHDGVLTAEERRQAANAQRGKHRAA